MPSPVLVDPALVDEPDRHRVQVMVLVAPLLAGHDESRLFQDPEMPHDPEPGQLRNLGLQLAERHAVALKQPVQQQSPCRVGQGLEHQVLVLHRGSICDRKVTCQFWHVYPRQELPWVQIGKQYRFEPDEVAGECNYR